MRQPRIFPHTPYFLGFFFNYLVCVTPDGVGERRFPSAEPALAANAVPSRSCSLAGAPEIGWRGRRLARLGGSQKNAFLPPE